MNQYFRLFSGTLGAGAVLGIVLTGCSGSGTGGAFQPNATPTPTATATPTTPQPAAQVSNLTLGNGQRAILTTTVDGNNKITGSVQILAPAVVPAVAKIGTKAFSFSIPLSTYGIVSGTFTPPRSYNITGNFGALGSFSMSGLLPTTTQEGTYTLSVNGQTESGIIAKVGQTFPTPTPNPTTQPTTPPGGTVNITFTPSSDSNFVNVPALPKFTIVQAAPDYKLLGIILQSDVQIGKDGIYLAAALEAKPNGFVDLSSFSATGYIYNTLPSGVIKSFLPESGTISIVSLSSTSATIRFTDAVYRATGASNGKGSVKLNGTVTAPISPNP